MTRIKICGITHIEDAVAASEFGADALGFIFVPGSPRYVGADDVKVDRLLTGLPPFVWKVGVFETLGEARQNSQNLNARQYYNVGELPTAVALDGPPLPLEIRAFRIRDEASLIEVENCSRPGDVVLLDAYSAKALGGTGHRFNWNLATQVKETGRRIILAGGLTADNVGDAVRAVRPYMVDVSSGVEAEPGHKDLDKLQRFIRAVREADLDV